MGLAHYIAEGWQLIAGTLQTENPPAGVHGVPILPGGLYYGERGEIDTPVYPLGRLEIQEVQREHHTGGGALATYEVRLTVYSVPGQDYAAEIARRFEAYLSLNSFSWQAIPDALGRIVSIVPASGTLDEDPDTELGQDADRASVTWQFTLSERAAMTAEG
jgi:hypothetical protein